MPGGEQRSSEPACSYFKLCANGNPVGLSCHAEYDYTHNMRVRLGLLVVSLLASLPTPIRAAESSPRETLATLNALRLETEHVYTVAPADRVELRLGDLVLTFEEGKIAFYQPFDGKVTGFVF